MATAVFYQTLVSNGLLKICGIFFNKDFLVKARLKSGGAGNG
jgi:hypothetical protein